MKTITLDCRSVAKEFRDWVVQARDGLKTPPCLATVLLRPESAPASLRYRDLILKDAADLGISTRIIEPADEGALGASLESLQSDAGISGVVVFYPLRSSLCDEDVMDMVSPHQDVEGLHSVNLGYLIKFKRYLDAGHRVKCVVPATAKAVVKTLQSAPDIPIAGAFVTIVNNSMRVGKPLGLMLENLGATVVKCYDKTPAAALEGCVRRSDIVITAVPDPAFKLDSSWVREGAAVVDVSFQGNIDAAGLKGRAAFMTEPGNGIGQVTRAMMFVNLIYCAHIGRSHEAAAAG